MPRPLQGAQTFHHYAGSSSRRSLHYSRDTTSMTPRDYKLPMPQTHSLIDSMCEDICRNSSAPDAYQSLVQDLPADESPVDLPVASAVTQVRPLTPAKRSLRFLETGAPGSPCVPMLSSRAAVLGTCLASQDLHRPPKVFGLKSVPLVCLSKLTIY